MNAPSQSELPFLLVCSFSSSEDSSGCTDGINVPGAQKDMWHMSATFWEVIGCDSKDSFKVPLRVLCQLTESCLKAIESVVGCCPLS